MSENVVSWEEFEKHIYSYDCWVMVEEKVYNVSDFLVEHPGGDDILVKYLSPHPGSAAGTPLPTSTTCLTPTTPSVSATPASSAESSRRSPPPATWTASPTRRSRR